MIAALLARVKTIAQIRLAAGLAEWSVLDAPPLLSPAAYVLPAATAAQPNGVAAGGFRQALSETAQVMLLVRNLRDPRAEAASLDLIALRDIVRANLLGWVPLSGWEPLELVEGRLFEAEDGVAVWRDLVSSRSQFFKA